MFSLEPARQPDEATFFVALIEQLDGDYASAATVFALLAHQADLGFVKASHRDLSQQLGERVTAPTLLRALASLEALTLVERKAHPNTTARYRVNIAVLRALLGIPLSEAEVIPGLTPLPARMGQIAALTKNFPVLQSGPIINEGASSSYFFVALLNRLAHDYPLCATLFALLARQADLGHVKASQRELSESIGCRVSHRHMNRALATLESLELLERQVVSKQDIRYRVDVPALCALLDLPLSEAEVTPGLTPLPALDRIFAVDVDPVATLETYPEGIC